MSNEKEWVDYSQNKSVVEGVVADLPEYARKALLREVLTTTFEDRRELEGFFHNVRHTHKNTTPKPPDTTYFTLAEQKHAYSSILERGFTPEEALALIGDVFDRSEEFIQEARKKRHAGALMKQVVRDHDKHPRQARMKRSGLLDKRGLLKSSTPNDQLARLSKAVVIDQRIADLEAEVSALKDSHSISRGMMDVQTHDVSAIQEILGLKVDKEEKVLFLKEKGYTQKEVAKILGVGVRTVGRYWNLTPKV